MGKCNRAGWSNISSSINSSHRGYSSNTILCLILYLLKHVRRQRVKQQQQQQQKNGEELGRM
jgi:hypothetical protein